MSNAQVDVVSLQEDTREQLKSELCGIQLEDHRDIEGYDMYEGYSWVGYNNMTDVELVKEYAQCVWHWTDLMKKCLSELGADAVMKNLPVPDIDTSELEEQVDNEDDAILKALIGLRCQFAKGTVQYTEIAQHIAERKALLAAKATLLEEA